MNIKNKLKYNELESKLYIPNEIFNDLSVIENGSHRAFAYSYYYLINYLYRNAKYSQFILNINEIKEILCYNKNDKRLNYIVKKGGVLDQLNYTETTADYPIEWELDTELMEPVFHLVSELDENTQKLYKSRHTNRHVIKYPLRSFYREIEDKGINYLSGTYYDIQSTHLIEFEVFDFCMRNSELGCVGFYIYSYLKMMNDKFPTGYDGGRYRLGDETGVKPTTFERYRKTMRGYNMLTVIHNQSYFSTKFDRVGRKASTNKVNHFSQFSNELIEYDKLKCNEKEDNIQSDNNLKHEDDKLLNLFT
ncbi:hypothetical protein ACFVRU_34835 [Streptomyces sp. NPDC057927]